MVNGNVYLHPININPIRKSEINRYPNFHSLPNDKFERSTYNIPKYGTYPGYHSEEIHQKFSDYATEEQVNKLMEKNPRAKALLANYVTNPNVKIEHITDIKNTHLDTTSDIAKKIAQNLNFTNNEIKLLEEGAIFHDFGKCLIPDEIVNKTSTLTPEERKIMSKHADLGYELLRHENFNPRVLEMIKNHHKILYKPGNPLENANTKLTQVLNVADIYSALTMERSYKKAYTPEEALKIMKKLVDEEKINPEIYDALCRSVRPLP